MGIPAFKVVATALALTMIAMGLGGCSSSKPVPRRQSGIIVGTQGAGSEVVFGGVQIAALDDACVGPEYARRDAGLAMREPATAFDFDSWPAAPQPTLDHTRRIFISDTPTQFMYFNSGGNYRYRSYQNTCPYYP